MRVEERDAGGMTGRVIVKTSSSTSAGTGALDFFVGEIFWIAMRDNTSLISTLFVGDVSIVKINTTSLLYYYYLISLIPSTSKSTRPHALYIKRSNLFSTFKLALVAILRCS